MGAQSLAGPWSPISVVMTPPATRRMLGPSATYMTPSLSMAMPLGYLGVVQF